MRLPSRLRRMLCRVGWHVPIGWFYPTGKAAPAYEQRIECLWCLERFR